MVARLWRLTILVMIAFAVAAGCLARLAGADARVALLAGLAALAALPLAFCGVSLSLARAANTPAARPGLGSAARSWLHESGSMTRAMVHMALEPREPQRSPLDRATLRRVGRPAVAVHYDEGSRSSPVLLLHGLLCNRAVWWRLRPRLEVAGAGPLLAVNLEPPLADIDSHVAAVQSALQQLAAYSGARSITIVAHSMGGLVARALLAAGPCVPVSLLVTLATPHLGTRLAPGLGTARAIGQLHLGSHWLRALAARPVPAGVRVVSIYGGCDNLVAPEESLRLAGAENHRIPELGHFSLLTSAAVARLIGTLLVDRPARARGRH